MRAQDRGYLSILKPKLTQELLSGAVTYDFELWLTPVLDGFYVTSNNTEVGTGDAVPDFYFDVKAESIRAKFAVWEY